ncbi:hypothetical protein J2W37_002810 [Variovorax paradoxus]|uniref:head decoration protein n=1 Tax=Variovorax paradoxus TaxID=34073 RepID=UPI00278BAAB1|nr:head decoration protein [Variovorax paradoxus]MDP9965090.1 hypothetical protein [Variovorax paradoxus]
MNYRASFSTEGVSASKVLVAGNAHLLVGRKVTLLAGAVYAAGTVLGVITASKKHTVSASAATDGSEEPDLILAETVDATAGDREALGYARGDFNTSALVLGAGHTVASITEALRTKGITLLADLA